MEQSLYSPLLVEFLVGEELHCNACAIDGRVGIERPDQDLQLGLYCFLLCFILADIGQSTTTFT